MITDGENRNIKRRCSNRSKNLWDVGCQGWMGCMGRLWKFQKTWKWILPYNFQKLWQLTNTLWISDFLNYKIINICNLKLLKLVVICYSGDSKYTAVSTKSRAFSPIILLNIYYHKSQNFSKYCTVNARPRSYSTILEFSNQTNTLSWVVSMLWHMKNWVVFYNLFNLESS